MTRDRPTSALAFVNADRPSAYAALLLIAALGIATFAYLPALTGSFHFDDPHNLGGLAAVVDGESALRFITHGSAGPLGRPLALASFVTQAYAWPHSPEVFLATNIAIHLLNGTLVVWAFYLLGIARGDAGARAALTASMSGAIWMLLPILASSSLMIVQRMTTLSTVFVLAGLIVYLYGRRLIDRRPILALVSMSAALTLGTVLAVFTKESGALLPLLVLAAEATLLPRPTREDIRTLWRVWQAVFLVLPATALLAYLLTQFQYDPGVAQFRGFSGADRVLTQAKILWEYLLRAFVPAPSGLGPFHDDYPLSSASLAPSSLVAVAAWAIVGIVALAKRRKAPLFAFAAGWYLLGHSLESTTVPLELYFEHRNYVPLIGPVFALVAGTSTFSPSWERLSRGALAGYSLVLAGVLWSTANLWGQPAVAAEMWAIYNPDSTRANQYLAQQLERNGDFHTARRVLQSYLDGHPESTGVTLQVLALSCVIEPDEPHEALVAKARADLEKVKFQHGIIETLANLYRKASAGQCAALTRHGVYELAQTAAANPSFRGLPVAEHNLHVLMAEEAFAQRNLDLTMRHLETALAAKYTMTTLLFAVQALRSAGLDTTADEFLREARRHEPLSPILATTWRRQLAILEEAR